MIVDNLKKSILQYAFEGKLTLQNKKDGLIDNLLNSVLEEKNKITKKNNKLDEIKEVPFSIPDNWKWVRWGDLSNNIQYGVNTGAKDKGNAKLVRISDIQNNEIVWDNVPFCEVKDSEIEQYLLNENDILFARTGGTVGKSVVVKKIPTDYPYIFAGYLIRSNYSSKINYNYLKYFMESDLYWKQLRQGTIGSAQPNCNGQTLSKMILPIPPLEEQQRIVDKIEELFSKLDEVKPIEEDLEKLNKSFSNEMYVSILNSAVQGKLTTQNLDYTVDDITKVIVDKKKKIRDVNDFPFEIPSNWKCMKLGDLVDFSIGKTPPRADSGYWGDDYNWVSISDMVENGYIYETKEKVSAKAFSNIFKENISKAGTLIMSFKLTVGRCSILNIDAFHNEGIISIYPCYESEILKKYLFNILPFMSKYGETKGAIKGNTLNSKSLDNLLIPIPPIEEQQRIVDKIEQLLPVCKDIDDLIKSK